MPMNEHSLCVAHIDLERIRRNVLRLPAPPEKLMPVIKSDAYGHGAVRCANASLSGGADWLGVATVDEGVERGARGGGENQGEGEREGREDGSGAAHGAFSGTVTSQSWPSNSSEDDQTCPRPLVREKSPPPRARR